MTRVLALIAVVLLLSGCTPPAIPKHRILEPTGVVEGAISGSGVGD